MPNAAAFRIMVPRLSAFLIWGQMSRVSGFSESSFRRLFMNSEMGGVCFWCPMERMPAWNL